MAVDERSRHELYVKLQEVLGPEPATTFMEMTPPVGTDVATTQDVAGVKQEVAAVRQDLGALKQDVGVLKQDVGALKQDVGVLKQDVGVLKQDLTSLRQEMGFMKLDLHKDIELVRFELLAAFRGEINTALTSQMKSIVFANTSLFVAFAGLVWSLKVF
ncbi:MAG TPA: hypothetical protein VNA57_10600 [Acidimicrobiales bacterium]|nr:hypothetical protein [Acidimicrobiales bacterium]